MSDIEKFAAKLSEDQSFAKQVGEIVESNEGNEIFNKLTALGEEHGLNVSAEELEEARKALASQFQAEGELDEEDLEQVSGGGGSTGTDHFTGMTTYVDLKPIIHDDGNFLSKW